MAAFKRASSPRRNPSIMVDDSHDSIVVLLPGLWMPAWVMLYLQRQLERAGLRCARFGYASARAGLAENSERLAACVRGFAGVRVDLVGHSLGGVLALHAAATHGLVQVRRIVLLGSPYRDSFTARCLFRHALGRWMLGKTVPQWLDCAKPSAPHGIEVGVVAGTLASGLGMLVAPGILRPHDGVIRTEETAVPGMAAYVEARVCHTGMLLSKHVGQLAAQFLLHGRFEARDAGKSPLAAGKGYALGPRRES